MLPYFRPPDVAGLHRCFFEFRSQEVTQLVDRYRNYKRYRFNKYVPISERFPEPSVDGLKFRVSNSTTERLIGMQTAWDLPMGCEISFRFTSAEVLDCAVGGFAEVGVGFLKFDTSWWWTLDALKFSCRRRSGSLNDVQYTTIRGDIIPSSGHMSGVGEAFTVTARNTGYQLELHYIEFALDGITPIVSHIEVIPLPDIAESYPVTMYCRGVDATAEYILARTDIKELTQLPPFVLDTYDFPYNGVDGTDGTPYTFNLEQGTYLVEAWGAGQGTPEDAGRGGYASGRLIVSSGFPAYIYVGGTPSTSIGGWNGGGNSGIWGGSGGLGGLGASDIRLVKSATWNDPVSLRSRILVAGGGGRTTEAGDGGGLVGAWATHSPYSNIYQGAPGTQNAGGAGGRAYYGTTVATPVNFSMGELFADGYRFSHGGVNQPSRPEELTGWSYNEGSDILQSTINSNSYIGLVSSVVSDVYDLEVKLISSSADDDRMGMVLAFAVDAQGREHTLSAIRNNDSPTFTWAVIYNYLQPDSWLIAEGSHTVARRMPPTWSDVFPNGTKIWIERRDNLITTWTSQTGSDTPDMATQLVIDLTLDPRLAIFNQPCAIGFSCFSQANTRFIDIVSQTYTITYPNSGQDGGFGFGGAGGQSRLTSYGHGGAGGWYGSGGAGGADTGSFSTSGGSSFVSGHVGCLAIDFLENPAANSIHFSGIKFRETAIQPGIRSEEHGQVKFTKILVPTKLNIPDREQIYFYENPTEYLLPLGPLQLPQLSIYSQPHVAYIEDGTIELSAPAAPLGWVNLLYFLVDSTVEPMVFSDIVGDKWLTCFQSAMGKGRKVQGTTKSGYELKLPVLVVH